jgi:hypothetical protein
MKKADAQQLAEVLLAYSRGEMIQYRSKGPYFPWMDMGEAPEHNFSSCYCEYRIKPKLRKVKVRLYESSIDGDARAVIEEHWSYWSGSGHKLISDTVEIEVKE